MNTAAAALAGSEHDVLPALEFRNVSKSFGGAHALRDVSLSIAPGEVHGLLGENGSGKSTLIKVLAGFHVPESGDLVVRGEPVGLPLPVGRFRSLRTPADSPSTGAAPRSPGSARSRPTATATTGSTRSS